MQEDVTSTFKSKIMLSNLLAPMASQYKTITHTMKDLWNPNHEGIKSCRISGLNSKQHQIAR